MRLPRRQLIPLLLVWALAQPCGAAELRITGGELATIVQTAFGGTVIRLHHQPPETPIHARSSSFVQLGPRLGGQLLPFSIPAHEFSLGPFGRARYYINDVNSNPAFVVASPKGPVRLGETIHVGATASAYVVTIRFEDSGTEIKGVPLGRMERLKDETVPDVEVNNIRLQILLYPTTLPNGQVSFKPTVVTFFGDIEAQGVPNLSLLGLQFDFLDELTDYKAEIKRSIESEVKRLIDRNLQQIGSNVLREAQRRGAAFGVSVSGIRFEGTNLVVSGVAAL